MHHEIATLFFDIGNSRTVVACASFVKVIWSFHAQALPAACAGKFLIDVVASADYFFSFFCYFVKGKVGVLLCHVFIHSKYLSHAI